MENGEEYQAARVEMGSHRRVCLRRDPNDRCGRGKAEVALGIRKRFRDKDPGSG